MTEPAKAQAMGSRISRHVTAYPWAYYLLLLLVLGYAQFWDARLFTWFADDFRALDHIEKVRQDVRNLFSPDHVHSGRPPTTLYLMAVAQVWGDNQIPVHLGLIGFHIFASWTLAWSLVRVGFETPLAMIGALLFLFSVSSYEVPYWVSCISYPGSLAFGCLGIVCYLQHADTRLRSSISLSVACFALSAVFHAGGIAFAVLAVYFGWRREVEKAVLIRTGWVPVVTSAGVSILFLLAFPLHVQNESTTHVADSLHLAWVTAAYLGRTYLSSHWLSQSQLYLPSASDSVVGLLLIAGPAGMFAYRRGLPLDAILWSALALPVFSGTNHQEYQSRYFYFANVGPALLFAWVSLRTSDWLGARLGSYWRAGALGLMVAAVLALSSHQPQRTEAVFWGAIGRDTLARGDSQKGLELLWQGILGAPDHIQKVIYVRYGVNAWFHGISPKNILANGIETYPRDQEIRLLHEVSEYLEGARTLPASTIDRIHNSEPSVRRSVADALKNAGSYAYNNHDYNLAERLYANSIQVLPNAVGTVINYANTLLEQGRLDDALTAYERAFEVGPSAAFPRTIPGLEAMLRARPNRWEARILLSHALIISNDLDAARNVIAAGPESKPQRQELFSKVFEELERLYRERGNRHVADEIRSQRGFTKP